MSVNRLGLGALACGSHSQGADCPCKRRARGIGFTSNAEPIDDSNQEPAAGAGIDWHWLAIAALAILAIWAAWPKPEKERRNVERRNARAAYLKKLASIDGPKGKKA